MNCLKTAIALTFCLQGIPLSGMDTCLSFNNGNETCDCCRSGWTGQGCKTECPNCGSRFVRNKCETFCQNASSYGTLCDIPCPAACLRNEQCNASCAATHQESTKDINQGRDDSEAKRTGASSQSLGSSSRTTEGALITIAVCAVLFVTLKLLKVCRKWVKDRKDKFNSIRSGSSVESTPLTSDDKAADSSTETEIDVAQPQAQLPHGGHSQNNDGLPWPQHCEEDMVLNIQRKNSVDNPEQDFDIH